MKYSLAQTVEKKEERETFSKFSTMILSNCAITVLKVWQVIMRSKSRLKFQKAMKKLLKIFMNNLTIPHKNLLQLINLKIIAEKLNQISKVKNLNFQNLIGMFWTLIQRRKMNHRNPKRSRQLNLSGSTFQSLKSSH